jgi:chromosomal replication initiation ATPase DnaA
MIPPDDPRIDHVGPSRQGTLTLAEVAEFERLSRIGERRRFTPRSGLAIRETVTIGNGMTAPHIAEIQQAVAARFGIRSAEMVSHRRARIVARPRQVAMYLSRQMTPLSLPAIGKHFGDRDHTTVMHACRKIEELIAADPLFAAAVAQIVAIFSADPNQGTLPLRC